jgi:hypothetical protein
LFQFVNTFTIIGEEKQEDLKSTKDDKKTKAKTKKKNKRKKKNKSKSGM